MSSEESCLSPTSGGTLLPLQSFNLISPLPPSSPLPARLSYLLLSVPGISVIPFLLVSFLLSLMGSNFSKAPKSPHPLPRQPFPVLWLSCWLPWFPLYFYSSGPPHPIPHSAPLQHCPCPSSCSGCVCTHTHTEQPCPVESSWRSSLATFLCGLLGFLSASAPPPCSSAPGAASVPRHEDTLPPSGHCLTPLGRLGTWEISSAVDRQLVSPHVGTAFVGCPCFGLHMRVHPAAVTCSMHPPGEGLNNTCLRICWTWTWEVKIQV